MKRYLVVAIVLAVLGHNMLVHGEQAIGKHNLAVEKALQEV